MLRSRRYDGAYYLAGYAVECALKACIAKKTKQFDFPDRNVQKVFTHDLARLLELAELTDAFEHEKTNDHSLELNWNTVKDWREQARYEKHTAVNAKRLVLAIADRKHGLLRCLKKYW